MSTTGARAPDHDWHAQHADEVMRALGSSATGLSDRDARSRLADHGPNRLPQAAGPSAAEVMAPG